ncbi:hypothetical protein [Brevundimonas sp.]|uniref:hypothetical protein n=1 Tax=Brevundimonas sp. TaxID=1871086 RepID=UPI002D693BB9|nr:hypothetical protein [Brevundimonas sp.]HYD28959.1 hypothetical protein [Brevundimonas sp.]
MSSTPPRDEPVFRAGGSGDGKVAALVGWGLFILSIPSAWVLVLVGLVVAYAARGSAEGLARQHLDAQIQLFWSVFMWGAVAIIGVIVSVPLMVVGIGFITIIVFGLAWFLISVWFTVKSIFGLIALVSDRAP